MSAPPIKPFDMVTLVLAATERSDAEDAIETAAQRIIDVRRRRRDMFNFICTEPDLIRMNEEFAEAVDGMDAAIRRYMARGE